MWILFPHVGLCSSGCSSQVIARALGELLELWALVSEQKQRQHGRDSFTRTCVLVGTELLHVFLSCWLCLIMEAPMWTVGEVGALG